MKKNSEKPIKIQKVEEVLNKIELNISEILTEISNQNAEIEFNPDDPFSRPSPSKVTMQYFFGRIKRYSEIENSTLIIILIYVDRMCITSGIILNPHNIHRLILGCLILAIKYNEDVYFNNEYYAKVGGISLKEMNNLEEISFELIDYNLFISDDIYKKYLDYIKNYKDEKSQFMLLFFIYFKKNFYNIYYYNNNSLCMILNIINNIITINNIIYIIILFSSMNYLIDRKKNNI